MNSMYTWVSNVQMRMLNKFPIASTTMAVARGRLVTATGTARSSSVDIDGVA